MNRVETGLANLMRTPKKTLNDRRLGLLCNSASVDRHFRHARDLLQAVYPGQLTSLFFPQHGFYAEKQDNMVESEDRIDPATGLPVFSLYGQTRQPTAAMFDLLDVLLIDLQDVGTRVYTFATTISYCLEAAHLYSKHVIVLDRPNPVSGERIEGNLLDGKCASFVGRFATPMRHGLTIGELTRFINDEHGIGASLEVIPMNGWRRYMFFNDTALPWVAPSPNLPTPASALVYPGQVIWEGTNVSEGRGTTQPFELFGAPYFNPADILKTMDSSNLAGLILRPIEFMPTANKWCHQLCHGFQMHVTHPLQFQAYSASLELLRAVIKKHRSQLEWKSPPYEYEFDRLPIDLILGDATIRQRLETLDHVRDLVGDWQSDLENYAERCKKYHLYK